MKPLRLLQWLLGSLLGLGLIIVVAGLIVMPFIFNLLWAPPRPEVEGEQPLTAVDTEPAPTPPSEPSPPATTEGRVTYGEGLRLRDRPDREGESLGGVAFDEVVTILERSSNGEWLKIRTQNNVEGWVLAFGIQEN